MQILDLHPLLYRHQLFSIIRYYEIALISYTNGLSLISFGLRGYCLGVLPIFLMYRIARLSSKVGSVTVRTSSIFAFNVLRALLDSPTSSS